MDNQTPFGTGAMKVKSILKVAGIALFCALLVAALLAIQCAGSGDDFNNPLDKNGTNYLYGDTTNESEKIKEVDGVSGLYRKYTVSFNANGGSGTIPNQSVPIGKSVTLPSGDSLSRSGYTFGGWNSKNDGSGTNYDAGSAYTPSGSVTLYAKWDTIPTYTVTFNYNYNGSSNTTATTGTDGKLTSLPTTPTRSGYTFDGWYTAASGGTQVTTSTVFSGHTTIYAHWTDVPVIPLTYSVTVTNGTGSGDYAAGATVNITANTAQSRQQFKNWTSTPAVTFANASNVTTTFTMPSNAVTVTANYEAVSSGCSGSDSTFMDSRDNKTYKRVTIGSQCWMGQNLNYNASGSVCLNNSDAYCNTYGRLYNWSTAMNGASSSSSNPSGVQGVCPVGWHLPSDAEWTQLENAVGGSSTAGTKLKSTSGWNSNGNGTDHYGFSALPGGYGYSDGGFYSAGDYGFWWSATEGDASYAWYRLMYYGSESVSRYSNYESLLFSVRCLQD